MMSKRQVSFFLIMFFFLLLQNVSLAQDQYPFASSIEEKRFQSLLQEIRCVVCQYQNIAESNAPLAEDLREKIYQLVANKKTNAEIKNYLTKRYGKFILFKPPFNTTTYFLWLFPFISLIFAISMVCLFIKKFTK